MTTIPDLATACASLAGAWSGMQAMDVFHNAVYTTKVQIKCITDLWYMSWTILGFYTFEGNHGELLCDHRSVCLSVLMETVCLACLWCQCATHTACINVCRGVMVGHGRMPHHTLVT